MTTPLKEALVDLADALAKRPAEEILFQWFRSGRLVGELSDLMKRRHPAVQAEIDRVYKEHLASRQSEGDQPQVARPKPRKCANRSIGCVAPMAIHVRWLVLPCEAGLFGRLDQRYRARTSARR